MGLVDHVTAELGDTDLEMLTILRMQFDVSIRTQECKLRIVARKHLELDDLRVKTTLALQGEFSRVEDLDHWRVDACRDYIVLIWGDPHA